MSSLHGPRLRVAVASEQSLVGDSVQAALDGRGLETARVAWPSPLREGRPVRGGQRSPRAGADVGLLLCELETPDQLDRARAVLSLAPERWLVLTGAPRGSAWGAVLAAGAHEVVSSDVTLDEIVDRLHRVAAVEEGTDPGDESTAEAGDEAGDGAGDGAGAGPPGISHPGASAVDPLVRQWEAACEVDAIGADRLASLTPREREVLELLHRGSSVTMIAETLGVTAATVRSQVKAVLRKLGVNSQLAAVAAFADQVALSR